MANRGRVVAVTVSVAFGVNVTGIVSVSIDNSDIYDYNVEQ